MLCGGGHYDPEILRSRENPVNGGLRLKLIGVKLFTHLPTSYAQFLVSEPFTAFINISFMLQKPIRTKHLPLIFACWTKPLPLILKTP